MTSVRAMHPSKLRDRPDNDHDCDTSDIDFRRSVGCFDGGANQSHRLLGRPLRASCLVGHVDGKGRRVPRGERGHSANAGHRSRKKGATPHGGRRDSLHGMRGQERRLGARSPQPSLQWCPGWRTVTDGGGSGACRAWVATPTVTDMRSPGLHDPNPMMSANASVRQWTGGPPSKGASVTLPRAPPWWFPAPEIGAGRGLGLHRLRIGYLCRAFLAPTRLPAAAGERVVAAGLWPLQGKMALGPSSWPFVRGWLMLLPCIRIVGECRAVMAGAGGTPDAG